MKESRKRKPEVVVFEEPARKQRKENLVKMLKPKRQKFDKKFSSKYMNYKQLANSNN